MRSRLMASVCLFCVFVFAALPMAQVTVSIDAGQEHQTIEGFGAHGSLNPWWNSGPFYTNEFLDLVVDDLGLTMNRNEFYPDFEETNENGDANSLDMSRFNHSGIFVNKQKGWIKALQAKADASGEPMRFIASYWSPPAWMKTNNSTKNGGALKSIARDELAEYTVATVRAYKEECNVDLYALSIQNEPAFKHFFNSCVYTPEQYRDAIKVVGPKLHAAYPDVKLFGAEDMLHNWTLNAYGGYIQSDPVSREHHNVFAVHGYSDGVHPTPTSEAVSKWKLAGRNCESAGKPLWMTETSGYTDTWSSAFELAEMMYAALKYGKLAAWVWWQISEKTSSSEFVIMYSGQPTKRYYIHKQYYRYIRPGAVMVDAVSSDTLMFSLAFHHKRNNTLSVVLINAHSDEQTVSLTGESLPTFTAYRTTSSENCAEQDQVTTSVTLPPSSVVTLYGQNYEPSLPVADPVSGSINLRALRGRGSAKVYTLDGRLVDVLHDVGLVDGRLRWSRSRAGRDARARGAYYAVFTDRTGASSARHIPVDVE